MFGVQNKCDVVEGRIPSIYGTDAILLLGITVPRKGMLSKYIVNKQSYLPKMILMLSPY